MALEDLTLYTEVDPNNRLTVTTDEVVWAGLTRNESTYLYKDFGVDYFSGDFNILFAFDTDAGDNGGIVYAIGMANSIDDWTGIKTASGDAIAVEVIGHSSAAQITHLVVELDGGTEYPSSQHPANFTNYVYGILRRDESVGTYGTIYLDIYTDSARTNLVTTRSVALHSSKKDFRYLFLAWSRNDGDPDEGNGKIKDIFVNLSTTFPTVTTQATTAIAATTATGNGNVTSLGSPAPTQHGHCWSISHLPTVSDSKTTNGVPSAGAYTSSLTGLTAGTKYYVRAYIQGAWGTLYGAEVAFTALGNEPSVSIQATTAIAATTATGNGNVLALGSPAPTQYGHCWDVIPSPTVVDSGNGFWGKTSKGVPGATGAYTSSLTGLEQNTLYYMRAYITDSYGVTFYSSQQASFTTLVGVPLVTTDEASEVTETSALGNGSIYNDGGASITQYGVVWDTNINPTIALATRTEEGVGVVGDFSSLMQGLTSNTLYHYRVYATNSEGTGYGADKTFSTNITGAPTLTSEDPSNLQETTVTGNGTLVSIGGSAVTEHGHCWSTSPDPTTADSKTTNGAATAGAFTSAITGLLANTTYYYRAYATNTQGTGYGNNVAFTMGYAFPVDTVSRVSGIRRTFWAGEGGSPGVYLAELFQGGLSTTFISPIGDREPPPSIPPPTPRPTPSGQGFQLSDYTRWLSQNTAFNIIRIFGHRPTYAEWVEYMKSQRTQGAGSGR